MIHRPHAIADPLTNATVHRLPPADQRIALVPRWWLEADDWERVLLERPRLTDAQLADYR